MTKYEGIWGKCEEIREKSEGICGNALKYVGNKYIKRIIPSFF